MTVARWRRSLLLRVAVTTFVLSATIVLALGVALLNQVARGLLSSTTRSALTEMAAGVSVAKQQLGAVGAGSQVGLNQAATAVAAELNNFGASAPSSFRVALLTSSPGLADDVGGDLTTASIPLRLQRTVARSASGLEAYTYTQLLDSSGLLTPALVVGAPVRAGDANYQLYYVFPLRQAAQTLQVVRRTLLFAGVVIVALLMGLTALVTRQVVNPVRLAARTAERFAGGRLQERMAVRGEDDLARLATSFNRMAGRLQRQIARLEDLSRVQQRFVADVSHELRTPLTTVRMAADVLHEAREMLPVDAGRAAELLQTQLDRFEALLSDLLEISRHDAGAAVLESEPVDMRLLVRRVVAGLELLAGRRGVSVAVQVPDHPVVAEVDQRRVDRILRNLVANAIEHGEGQPVEVQLEAGPRSVAVVVADHGAGLAPGEGSLVFGRFWRADPSRARATGGTGLGLAIALEDARLHGGWLQAWGEPGRGCRFRLTVPARAGAAVTSSPLPLEPPAAQSALAERTEPQWRQEADVSPKLSGTSSV
ncbi:MAG: MtrAB system histidine kinase MtrB [Mycobacteriales bacterium]